jgi:hypothetical protein
VYTWLKFIFFSRLVDVKNKDVGLVTLACIVVQDSGTVVLTKLKDLH